MRRDETRRATRRALEAVRIGSDLIAFYPQEIHQPQPYVIILVDPASGILKRLREVIPFLPISPSCPAAGSASMRACSETCHIECLLGGGSLRSTVIRHDVAMLAFDWPSL